MSAFFFVGNSRTGEEIRLLKGVLARLYVPRFSTRNLTAIRRTLLRVLSQSRCAYPEALSSYSESLVWVSYKLAALVQPVPSWICFLR